MRKKLLSLVLAIGLLTGCASEEVLLHEYKNDINNDSTVINKEDRLDSFSQGQVYLKDNSEYPVEDVSANQALLFEFNNDDNPVLLCKNAYQQFQPGFLTRLYGAYMVASNSDIYTKVTINADIYQVDTALPCVGFGSGDELRIKDLLYGATIASKCDVMIPIAISYSNNVAGFSSDINSFLKKLGCEQTNITNIYGSDQSGQYTNIYDLYVALTALLKNEDICSMLTSRNYVCDYTNAGNSLSIPMYNNLPYFSESGYTTSSGLNIIGGICDINSENYSSMLVLASGIDGREYVAYVSGCKGYENTKTQMELILSKITH